MRNESLPPKRERRNQLWSDMLLGGAAGVVSKTCVRPYERLYFQRAMEESNTGLSSNSVRGANRQTAIGALLFLSSRPSAVCRGVLRSFISRLDASFILPPVYVSCLYVV